MRYLHQFYQEQQSFPQTIYFPLLQSIHFCKLNYDSILFLLNQNNIKDPQP